MRLVLLLIWLATTQPASRPELPVYRCAATTAPVTIDGKLDEAAWSQAAWTDDFVDIRGGDFPAPPQRTRVKLIRDDKHLYLAAEMMETDVRARMTRRDDQLFRENAFEVFIDPDGDGLDYIELEINALNTIFDLKMNKPYRAGGRADASFSLAGLRTAVGIDGTINDPSDRDRSWTIELAIPIESVSGPSPGARWRMNFARAQHDPGSGDASYSVWSPHGRVNMHMPEQWGWVEFIESEKQP